MPVIPTLLNMDTQTQKGLLPCRRRFGTSLPKVMCTGLVVVACASVLAVSSPGQAPSWKPVEGRLLTRFARDVSPDAPRPEYPRPQLVRKDWLNLNGLWQYAIRPKDATSAGSSFDGDILVPFPVESALSGVGRSVAPDQRVWYRRLFRVPPAWKGKRVWLRFDAVDWESIVVVNGREVGRHTGGYDPFGFDITDALTRQPDQEIVLSVWDPSDAGPQPRGKQVLKPRGIWYTPTTGIWQTVWLEPLPAAAIERLTIVPDIDKGTVSVAAVTIGRAEGLRLRATIAEEKLPVASAEGPAARPLTITVPMPRLWSPNNPFLYDLSVTLREGRRTLDAVTSYFGMRKIALGKDEKGFVRMLLNGQFVFQIGPLDQGYWPDGIYTAPTDGALRYDIEMTRHLGFNVTRKHVKIEPARWYYWCDRLGLLVWQDMPSSGGTKSPEGQRQFEAELKAMIDGLYSHPSIIMWVIFNEGWGQYDTERLTDWVKQLDPTRLVNTDSGARVPCGDVIDDHGYWIPTAMKQDGRRAVAVGEFGGRALVIPGHVITEKVFGHPGGTVFATPWELTRQYIKLLRHIHEEKEKNGLNAAIYTQLTDIEAECNGFLTYDRAVVKMDLAQVAAANRGEFPPLPQFRVLSPLGQAKDTKEPVLWRYTLDKPPDDWAKPDFDDSAWKEAPAGFGKGAWRTQWTTPDLWMRREFSLAMLEEKPKAPELLAHHDKGVEIYLNGVLASTITGYSIEWQEFEIRPEAKATLKPGRNVLAVHTHKGDGGQYIDVGLVDP